MTAAIDQQRPLSHADHQRFLPLVRRIAMRLARRVPSHVTVNDLMSCGWVGLAEAFSRTGGDMPEEELEAYASARIRGAMLDYLRGLDPATRQVRTSARRLHHARGQLERTLGRPAESEEVADALGVDLETYHQLVQDTTSASAAHVELLDGHAHAESAASAPDAVAERRVLTERVAEAIGTLPERLQQLLAMYYQEGCTLKEIGVVLGVTESRVCQLHGEAVRRLRAQLS